MHRHAVSAALCGFAFFTGCGLGNSSPSSERARIAVGTEASQIRYAPESLQRASLELTFNKEVIVAGDGQPRFGYARRLAVDHAGDIYILDLADSNVKVFAPDGTHRATMGRPGEGPGEFSKYLSAIAIAGDYVVISDIGNRRLSVWSREGVHIKDMENDFGASQQPILAGLDELVGLADGGLVGLYGTVDPTRDEFRRFVVIAIDVETGVVTEVFNVADRQAYAVAGGRMFPVPFVSPELQLAGPGDGGFFASTTEDYEVVAFQEASASWALQVRWSREPAPRAEYDRAVSVLSAMPGSPGRGLNRSDIVAVDPLRAIGSIKSDGRGNLYVFPFVYYTMGRPETWPESMVVHIYDPAGGLIGTAQVPSRFGLQPDQSGSWLASQGDYVYGLETPEDRDDQVVVRYLLRRRPARRLD